MNKFPNLTYFSVEEVGAPNASFSPEFEFFQSNNADDDLFPALEELQITFEYTICDEACITKAAMFRLFILSWLKRPYPSSSVARPGVSIVRICGDIFPRCVFEEELRPCVEGASSMLEFRESIGFEGWPLNP